MPRISMLGECRRDSSSTSTAADADGRQSPHLHRPLLLVVSRPLPAREIAAAFPAFRVAGAWDAPVQARPKLGSQERVGRARRRRCC